MKHKLRKAISILLAAAMLLSLVPVSAEEVAPGIPDGGEGAPSDGAYALELGTTTSVTLRVGGDGKFVPTFSIDITDLPAGQSIRILIVSRAEIAMTVNGESRSYSSDYTRLLSYALPGAPASSLTGNYLPMWSYRFTNTGTTTIENDVLTPDNCTLEVDGTEGTAYKTYANITEGVTTGGVTFGAISDPDYVAIVSSTALDPNNASLKFQRFIDDVVISTGVPLLEGSITGMSDGTTQKDGYYEVTGFGTEAVHVKLENKGGAPAHITGVWFVGADGTENTDLSQTEIVGNSTVIQNSGTNWVTSIVSISSWAPAKNMDKTVSSETIQMVVSYTDSVGNRQPDVYIPIPLGNTMWVTDMGEYSPDYVQFNVPAGSSGDSGEIDFTIALATMDGQTFSTAYTPGSAKDGLNQDLPAEKINDITATPSANIAVSNNEFKITFGYDAVNNSPGDAIVGTYLLTSSGGDTHEVTVIVNVVASAELKEPIEGGGYNATTGTIGNPDGGSELILGGKNADGNRITEGKITLEGIGTGSIVINNITTVTPDTNNPVTHDELTLANNVDPTSVLAGTAGYGGTTEFTYEYTGVTNGYGKEQVIIHYVDESGDPAKPYLITVIVNENELEPASLEIEVAPDGEEVGTLTIKNVGTGDLTFGIAAANTVNGTAISGTTAKFTENLATSGSVSLTGFTDTEGEYDLSGNTTEIQSNDTLVLTLTGSATSNAKEGESGVFTLKLTDQYGFEYEFPITVKVAGASTYPGEVTVNLNNGDNWGTNSLTVPEVRLHDSSAVYSDSTLVEQDARLGDGSQADNVYKFTLAVGKTYDVYVKGDDGNWVKTNQTISEADGADENKVTVNYVTVTEDDDSEGKIKTKFGTTSGTYDKDDMVILTSVTTPGTAYVSGSSDYPTELRLDGYTVDGGDVNAVGGFVVINANRTTPVKFVPKTTQLYTASLIVTLNTTEIKGGSVVNNTDSSTITTVAATGGGTLAYDTANNKWTVTGLTSSAAVTFTATDSAGKDHTIIVDTGDTGYLYLHTVTVVAGTGITSATTDDNETTAIYAGGAAVSLDAVVNTTSYQFDTWEASPSGTTVGSFANVTSESGATYTIDGQYAGNANGITLTAKAETLKDEVKLTVYVNGNAADFTLPAAEVTAVDGDNNSQHLDDAGTGTYVIDAADLSKAYTFTVKPGDGSSYTVTLPAGTKTGDLYLYTVELGELTNSGTASIKSSAGNVSDTKGEKLYFVKPASNTDGGDALTLEASILTAGYKHTAWDSNVNGATMPTITADTSTTANYTITAADIAACTGGNGIVLTPTFAINTYTVKVDTYLNVNAANESNRYTALDTSSYVFTLSGVGGTFNGSKGANGVVTFSTVPHGTYTLTIKKGNATVEEIESLEADSDNKNLTNLFYHTVKVQDHATVTGGSYTVDGASASVILLTGESVSPTATTVPNNYTLDGWDVGGGDTSTNDLLANGSYTVANVTGEITLTPILKADVGNLTLTVTVNGSGAVMNTNIRSIAVSPAISAVNSVTTLDSDGKATIANAEKAQEYEFTITTVDGGEHKVKGTTGNGAVLELYTVQVKQNTDAEDTVGSVTTATSSTSTSVNSTNGDPVYVAKNGSASISNGAPKNSGYTFSNTWNSGAITNSTLSNIQNKIEVTPDYTWEFTVKTINSSSNPISAAVKVGGTAIAENPTGEYKVTGLTIGTTYGIEVNGYATEHTALGHAATADKTVTITLYKLEASVKYVTTGGDSLTWSVLDTVPQVSVDGNEYVPSGVAATLTVTPGTTGRYTEYNTTPWSGGNVDNATKKITMDGGDKSLTYNVIPAWKVTLGAAQQTASASTAASAYTATVKGTTGLSENRYVWAQVAGTDGTSENVSLGTASATGGNAADFVFSDKWKVAIDGSSYSEEKAKDSSITVKNDTTKVAPLFYQKPKVTPTLVEYEKGTTPYPKYAVALNDATEVTAAKISGTDYADTIDDGSGTGTKDVTLEGVLVNGLSSTTHTVAFDYKLPDDENSRADVTAELKITGTDPKLISVTIGSTDVDGDGSVNTNDTVGHLSHNEPLFNLSGATWTWYYADGESTQTVVGTNNGSGVAGATQIGTFTGSTGGAILAAHAGKFIYAVVEVNSKPYYTNSIPVTYSATVTVQKDGNVYEGATVSIDGGTTPVTTDASGVAKFENLVPTQSYTVTAPTKLGDTTGYVSTGVTIDNVDDTTDNIVYYWTIPAAKVEVKHAATDGQPHTQAEFDAGVAWKFINPVVSLNDTTMPAPTPAVGTVVLKNTEVKYPASTAGASHDYAFAWSTGATGELKVNITSTTPPEATLTQRTHTVKVKVTGTGTVDEFKLSGGTDEGAWSLPYTDDVAAGGEKVVLSLPLGTYTVSDVIEKGGVLSDVDDINSDTAASTSSTFEVAKIEGNRKENGVLITLDAIDTTLKYKVETTRAGVLGIDETNLTNDDIIKETGHQYNTYASATYTLTIRNAGNSDYTNLKIASTSDVAGDYTFAETGFTNDTAFTLAAGASVTIVITVPDKMGAGTHTGKIVVSDDDNASLAEFTLSYEVLQDTLKEVITDRDANSTTGIAADTTITVTDVTANNSDPAETAGTDVTYQWYVSDDATVSIPANPGNPQPGEDTPVGSDTIDFTPAGCEGKWVYVVATPVPGKNYDTTTVASTPIPILYEATITVTVDGGVPTAKPGIDVKNSGGTSVDDTYITWDDTQTYTVTNLLPGETYTVYAPVFITGTSATENVDTIRQTDKNAEVKYWSVTTEPVTINEVNDLGTIPGDYVKTVTAKVGGVDVTAVLNNTQVAFGVASWSGHDYDIQWKSKKSSDPNYTNVGNDTNAYNEAITGPTIVTAELTQRTYDVTVKVIGTGTVEHFLIQTATPKTVSQQTDTDTAATQNGAPAGLTVLKLPNGTYSIAGLDLATGTQLEGYSADGSNPSTAANAEKFTISGAAGGIYIHVSQPTLKLTVTDNKSTSTSSGTATYNASTGVADDGIASFTTDVIYGSSDPVEVILTLKNDGNGTLYQVTGTPGGDYAQFTVDTTDKLPATSDDVTLTTGDTDTVKITFNPSNKAVDEYTATYTFGFAAEDDGALIEGATVTYTITVNVVEAKITDLYAVAPVTPVAGNEPVETAPKLYPVGNALNYSGTLSNVKSETVAEVGADISTVTWFNEDGTTSATLDGEGKFLPGKVYVAKVTVSLTEANKPNYEFVAANKTAYHDSTSTPANPQVDIAGDGNSITLTYTFGVTAPAKPVVTASAVAADSTGGKGSVDKITVDTPKNVVLYWVARPATGQNAPSASAIINAGSDPSSWTKYGSQPTAFGSPAIWSPVDSLSGLDYGTVYEVYAVAVYQDDTGNENPSAVSDPATFKTWHKVIVTATNGEVTAPNPTPKPGTSDPVEYEHIAYVAPYNETDNSDTLIVTAKPNENCGGGTWTVDDNGDGLTKNGTFGDYTPSTAGVVGKVFTVDDEAAGTINIKVQFDGESNIEWDIDNAVANTLPASYADGTVIHNNTLRNEGMATADDIIYKVTYAPVTNGVAGTQRPGEDFFTLTPATWNGTDQDLDADETEDFTLSMNVDGDDRLGAGTYEIHIIAIDREGAEDPKTEKERTTAIITLKISENDVELMPDTAYWDLNKTLTNHLETTAGKQLAEWKIQVLGGGAVNGVLSISGAYSDSETPSGNTVYTYTNDTKIITIDASETGTFKDTYTNAKVGDVFKYDVKVDTTVGERTITPTVEVIDTTPILYSVDIQDSDVHTSGVTLTAVITSIVDRDWKIEDLPTAPVAEAGSTKGIIANGKNVFVDWYVSADGGANWTLAQSNADATTNNIPYNTFTVTDEHMGKEIMVVVTDNSNEADAANLSDVYAYRPRAELAATPTTADFNAYPVKDTVGTYLRVEAQVKDGQTSYGKITLPTANTSLDNDPHVTYVASGSPAGIIADPAVGYVFDKWELKVTDPTGAGNFGDVGEKSTTFEPTKNSIVVASFKPAEVKIDPAEYLGNIIYATKPDTVLVDVNAASTDSRDSVTYAITAATYTAQNGTTADVTSYFSIDADGKIIAIKAMDKNVVDTTHDLTVGYDTGDKISGEITLTVTVTSNNATADGGRTYSSATATVTIDILTNQLSITGTPNYPDVLSNATFDPSLLSNGLKVWAEDNVELTEGTAADQFTWSMEPSGFSVGTTKYEFVATHNPLNDPETAWNYTTARVEDEITVTQAAASMVFTDREPGETNYDNAGASNNYKSTDSVKTGDMPTYNVKLTNNGTVDLTDVTLSIVSGGDNFSTNMPTNTVTTFERGDSNSITFDVQLKDVVASVTPYTLVIKAEGTDLTAPPENNKVEATYTLEITVSDNITELGDITVLTNTPAPGGTPDTTPEPPAGSNYTITYQKWRVSTDNGSTWTDMSSSAKFEEGKMYQLVVIATPNQGYKFKDNPTYRVTDRTYNPDADTDGGSNNNDSNGTHTVYGEWELEKTMFDIKIAVNPTPTTANRPLDIPEKAEANANYEIVGWTWYEDGTRVVSWVTGDAPPTMPNTAKDKSYRVEVKVDILNGYDTTNVGDNYINSTKLDPNAATTEKSGVKEETTTHTLWSTWSVPGDPPAGGGGSTPKHEVTYVPGPNGETDDPLREEVRDGGYPENVPEITPKDDDYVFIGWITTDPETLPEGQPITPVNPEEVKIEDDTTFYAVVTKKEIKVTYELGSFGSTTDPTLEIVAKYDYPSFTPNVTIIESQKDLATFVGWSLTKPNNDLAVELVDPLTVQILKDTVFYAVYEITEYEYHEHYMIGYPDGNFMPDQNITRAEVATIIARAVLRDFIEGSWYGDGGYSDISGHWAQSAIAFTTAAGIFEGYEDGTFRPNRPITREEYATVIARLKGLLDGDRTDLANFGDVDAISDWAVDGVYTCVEEGWIIGYEDSTFKPRKDITRAEAAKMMNGYLNRGVDQPGISTVPAYIQFPDVYWGHWAYWEIAEAVNDHYYYYYYVDVDGNDIPPEQWVIEAGYLNVKLDDNDPDNTKNVRRSDPIYVNSISAGTGSN